MDMQELLNPISLISLAATAILACAAGVITVIIGKSCSKVDKWILFWVIWDAMIHFGVEGPFIFFSLTGTVKDSDHPLALLWKEYGKADKRWLVSDPTIVSLEILTVFFDGALCLVLIYAIVKNKFYRHYIQIVLCVCELYGGWMTFCPDWLIGSPNLVTDNWLYLWVYLVFFNGLWVIIPLALMYQSWEAMRTSFKFPSGHSEAPSSSKHGGRKSKMRSKKAA